MKPMAALRALIVHAEGNGFQFRQWFVANIGQEWFGIDAAIQFIASEGRHYALIFSHEFARCFWRDGSTIQFRVPGLTYSRVNGRGEVVQVLRKPFTRRTNRKGVWEYHLGQMAIARDPIAYLCKFLPVSDAKTPLALTRSGTEAGDH